MGKNIFVTMFLAFILCIPILSFAGADDHKDIFAERLVRASDSCSKLGEEIMSGADEAKIRMSTAEAEKLCNDLYNFSDEYPSSKFAEDAKRVAINLGYVNSVGNVAKQQNWLKKMEELAARSPDGKLDEFTIQKIYSKGESDYALMPHSVFLLSMQANMAYFAKDFESTVKYCSLLKDKLEHINDPSGVLVKTKQLNYTMLGNSYKALGKLDSATNIFEEAKNKFSDDAKFKELIERMERNSAPK